MNKTGHTREIQIKLDMNAHFTFSIEDTIGVCEDSRKLHWHNELEICHVKQGTGKYLMNGHVYTFEPGDVFRLYANVYGKVYCHILRSFQQMAPDIHNLLYLNLPPKVWMN